MITYLETYEINIDLAGKYRVRANCSDRVLLFKFQQEPTDDDIRLLVDKQLNILNAELLEIEKRNNTQIYSKLKIRRAMRDLGIEEQLNNLLNSSEIFKNDWNDASEIDLNDPITIQALEMAQIDLQSILNKLN